MSDLPYPFSRDKGRYYLVALGNGEYIRVVLAGDFTHERRRAEAWQKVARHLLEDRNPKADNDAITSEADLLFIDAYRGD